MDKPQKLIHILQSSSGKVEELEGSKQAKQHKMEKLKKSNQSEQPNKTLEKSDVVTPRHKSELVTCDNEEMLNYVKLEYQSSLCNKQHVTCKEKCCRINDIEKEMHLLSQEIHLVKQQQLLPSQPERVDKPNNKLHESNLLLSDFKRNYVKEGKQNSEEPSNLNGVERHSPAEKCTIYKSKQEKCPERLREHCVVKDTVLTYNQSRLFNNWHLYVEIIRADIEMKDQIVQTLPINFQSGEETERESECTYKNKESFKLDGVESRSYIETSTILKSNEKDFTSVIEASFITLMKPAVKSKPYIAKGLPDPVVRYNKRVLLNNWHTCRGVRRTYIFSN